MIHFVMLTQGPVEYFTYVYPTSQSSLAGTLQVTTLVHSKRCVSAAVCARKRESLMFQGYAEQELRTATVLGSTTCLRSCSLTTCVAVMGGLLCKMCHAVITYASIQWP